MFYHQWVLVAFARAISHKDPNELIYAMRFKITATHFRGQWDENYQVIKVRGSKLGKTTYWHHSRKQYYLQYANVGVCAGVAYSSLHKPWRVVIVVSYTGGKFGLHFNKDIWGNGGKSTLLGLIHKSKTQGPNWIERSSLEIWRLSNSCSAVQIRKFWVAQRTIHGRSRSLGGPCYIWVVHIWCGQKWQWNNNIVIYFQPATEKREIDISNSPIAWKFGRWLSSNAAKPHLPYFKPHDWSILRHSVATSRVQETGDLKTMCST